MGQRTPETTETKSEREREMFYLTTHSTHFIYGYMASDIWLRTILIVRKETRCRHIGYSYRLTAKVLLYAPIHKQDNTYHGLCYTSHGALAETRNSSMGSPHEGSIRRPIAPWANALPLSYVPHPIRNPLPPRCELYFINLLKHAGQVRSECLTCTFRASWCSARLSREQVPAFAGSSVRDRGKGGRE